MGLVTNEPLTTPFNAPDASRSLWTPSAIEYIQTWVVEPEPVWKFPETGERVLKHEFKLTYRGETEFFGLIGPDSTPESQIEDNIGAYADRAADRINERLSERGNKLIPEQLAERKYWSERRDLAGAYRDMRKNAATRRASSNSKIYYPGIH